MLGYELVADARINAIVVEEENAIAPPTLDHALDDVQRKPLVSERVDEREGRNEFRLVEVPGSFIVDLAAGDDRLIGELLDTRQLVYLLLKGCRILVPGVVKVGDEHLRHTDVVERSLKDEKRCRSGTIPVAPRPRIKVDVSDFAAMLGGGRHYHSRPSEEIFRDNSRLYLGLVRALLEEFLCLHLRPTSPCCRPGTTAKWNKKRTISTSVGVE